MPSAGVWPAPRRASGGIESLGLGVFPQVRGSPAFRKMLVSQKSARRLIRSGGRDHPVAGTEAMNRWPDDDVILYDGVCVFCSRWIRFVAARDRERRFRFTAIQSDYGARLALAFGIDPQDPDTNAVIHGGVAYLKSDGALSALSQLPGWSWTRAFLAIPRPLRDAVYNLIARNRYRIFGKYDACFVPDTEFRDRVME
jgi:predicted DCC family thiol-disulfide oxidoreductase YuxK